MSRDCRPKQVFIRTPMIIISLCMSVGQVQSLKKPNQRSQDTEVTSKPPTPNEIIEHRNVFPFDDNKRGWQAYQHWELNEPLATIYEQITYTVTVGNRKRQHLLISGANFPFSYFENKPGVFSNWLYTVNSYSWENVDNGDFPPALSSPAMIQLCSKIIAFEGDNFRYESVLINRAWIFDTFLLFWQKIQVDGRLPSWLDLETIGRWSPKIAAVAVFQSENNCKCHQSAFVLLHSSDIPSSMYEVRCVYRNGTERYKWIHIESNIQVPSGYRVKFIASSYSSTILLYDPVNQTLWKFENITWTNVITVPSGLQPFYDTSRSEKFGCAITTNNSSFIVFNILDNTVLNFDLKRKKFTIEVVVGDIPDHRHDVVSSVSENQNTIIVFTLDAPLERTRVWKFNYERQRWRWRKLSSPNIQPNFVELSTYALKSNYLTFAPVLMMETYDSWILATWNLDLTSMQWWKKHVSNSFLEKDVAYCEYGDICWLGSCWIGNCCFLTLSNNINKNVMEVLIYNSTDNKLKLLISNSLIEVRYFMSFVAVNKTTAILFGGKNSSNTLNAIAFNETVIMHIQPTFQWRQSTRDISYSVQPSARFHHAAVIMQSQMYVFGGKDDSEACLSDLWAFDITTERWSELISDNRGPNLSNAFSCEYSAASTTGLIFININSMYPYRSYSYKNNGLQTWMFIVQVKKWYCTSLHINSRNIQSKG